MREPRTSQRGRAIFFGLNEMIGENDRENSIFDRQK